ncbi:hypothetical protein [Pseudomonas oryzihabitans]|uniref:hypothetical protein n=1 Tax=Pseudomonas oryzihabitans TaxID=47885 RepID=UPI002893D660|nr:hypothetical protein [Pseudomonas oryzihabitans]MDT3723255.1 hypothetical protein [Pseudomonas oryzihabitans]
MSDNITRRHSAQRLLQQLEKNFPDCNCLLSPIGPDGAVAVRVMPKHRTTVVILHVDAQRLADTYYVAEQVRHIRDHLKQS